MGFQVYDSTGQELQKVSGTAGGDLTGTYPNPTLATTLYDSLGLTKGSNTRRATTIATTERSNTSTSWTDVTGCSVTVTVATNSVSVIYVNFDLRGTSGQAGQQGVRLVYGSTPTSISAITAAQAVYEGVLAETNISTYYTYAFALPLNSGISGTGSQTFKLQTRTTNSGNTGYVKNVYLTAINWTY